jgi:hypothetical protein
MGMTIDVFRYKYSGKPIPATTISIYYEVYSTGPGGTTEDERSFKLTYNDLSEKLNETKEYLKYIENSRHFVRWKTPTRVMDIHSLKIEREIYEEENIEWV